MTWIPGASEPRREPLGQPAAPADQPLSPYPPTVPLPAPYSHQPAPPPSYVQTPLVRPTSGYATASMVFGILGAVSSCCSFGIFSIVAVLLGHIALHETKEGFKGGHGMAIAGLVLGYLIVIPAIILSIMLVTGGLIGSLSPDPSATP